MSRTAIRMTTTTQDKGPASLADYALLREAQDIRVRSRVGGMFYVIAWTVSWYFSDHVHTSVLAGSALTAVYVGLMLLRLAHRLPKSQEPEVLRRWLAQHWALLILTALAWGLTYAGMVLDVRFAPSRLIGAISTVAFSTAMALTYAMNRRGAFTGIMLMYLPGLAALGCDWDLQKTVLLNLAVYMGYLLLALRRDHVEYHGHVRTEYELIEERARFRQLSRTDSLTQLGNRHEFSILFDAAVAQHRRRGAPLSLLLFDIDLFKQINDRHGHAGGDACLRAFADCLRETFPREADTLARLGGEEFAVLLADTPLEDAWHKAEQFREALFQLRPQWSGEAIVMSTSAGVGSLDAASDRDPDAFFQRVDRALYRAKEEGRNRTARAEPAGAEGLASATDPADRTRPG